MLTFTNLLQWGMVTQHLRVVSDWLQVPAVQDSFFRLDFQISEEISSASLSNKKTLSRSPEGPIGEGLWQG